MFAFGLLGELAASVLSFTMPSSVLGLLFLLIALRIKLISTERLEPAAGFLSANMAFFFLPSTVQIMKDYTLIQDVWGPLLLICLCSTLVTFFVTYGVTCAVRRWLARKDR